MHAGSQFRRIEDMGGCPADTVCFQGREAQPGEDGGGEFTYIANDLKDVEPEHRETIDKMVERLEEFDDVQTVYTNMKPEESEE